MSEEWMELRERQAALELRIGVLERTLGELLEEVRGLSRLLRGNGEHGLVGQVELAHERIAGLRAQWRWLAGLLVAVVLAVLKSLLVG